MTIWERLINCFTDLPKQGDRSDLVEAFYLIKEGADIDEVVDKYPSQMIQYSRKFDEVIKKMRDKNWKPKATPWYPEVIVYYGKTGCGKSMAAFTEHKPTCWATMENKDFPWGSYKGDEVVAIDDFACTVPISTMLRWLGNVPVDVRIFQDGNKPFIPKKIVITSNINPFEWYENALDEHIRALRRRFTKVILCKHENDTFVQEEVKL